MARTKLRYGMVGGDLKAFIGGVHRHAIAIDETAELVAGCFNPDQTANQACGAHYGLDQDRVYEDYIQMAEAEAKREDRIDFVSICTPNRMHYEVAKKFVELGFHVVCEKPLCFEIEQAEELKALALEKGVLFAITYTYSGYAMIKQAKEMIENGVIGDIINVNAEYLQEWLIDEIGTGESSTTKLSVWRMDPKFSGISNCVGDIGTHIENTVSYLIGSPLKRVAAKLDYFSQPLDLNANLLVEFENGVHGVFSCSQVCVGHYNGLIVRIFGTKGAIEWVQETPDTLKVTLKGQPTQLYTRGAHSTGRAAYLSRIPSGHPEGLTMAFANIYRTFIDAVLNRINGVANDDHWALDFPSVEDGVHGVRFIHACVESNCRDGAWIEL